VHKLNLTLIHRDNIPIAPIQSQLETQYNGAIRLTKYRIANSGLICYKLIVDVLRLFEAVNTTQDHCYQLRGILTDIGTAALAPLESWTVQRVEYTHNLVVPDEYQRGLLVRLLHKIPTNILRTTRVTDYETSIYGKCNSKRINVYDKPAERAAHKKPIAAWERDVLRVEVQLMSGHIKAMGRYHGTQRDYDTWVSETMEQRYMGQLLSTIPAGDFYTTDKATELIQASEYSRTIKGHMLEYLEATAQGGMDTANSLWHRQTVRRYLEYFGELGVSPITIPDNSSIQYLVNPFRSLEPGIPA
jgi:hypothetical protein